MRLVCGIPHSCPHCPEAKSQSTGGYLVKVAYCFVASAWLMAAVASAQPPAGGNGTAQPQQKAPVAGPVAGSVGAPVSGDCGCGGSSGCYTGCYEQSSFLHRLRARFSHNDCGCGNTCNTCNTGCNTCNTGCNTCGSGLGFGGHRQSCFSGSSHYSGCGCTTCNTGCNSGCNTGCGCGNDSWGRFREFCGGLFRRNNSCCDTCNSCGCGNGYAGVGGVVAPGKGAETVPPPADPAKKLPGGDAPKQVQIYNPSQVPAPAQTPALEASPVPQGIAPGLPRQDRPF